MTPAHWLLAIAAVFVWGTNFVVITWGLADLPPFLFAALRFLLTAIPGMLLLRRPAVPWSKLAGYGMFVGTGQFGLLYFAMRGHITPGLASLIIQTQVFFTILISVMVKGQRLNPLQVLALTIACVGIGVVGWRSAHTPGSLVTLFGVALVLAAALSWALANALVQTLGRVDVIAFLVWSSAFAVPPLLLLSYCFDGPARPLDILSRMGVSAWGAVLWQVVGNTLFGYGVWNWLLTRYPATTVTPVALLVPVFGMTTSAWLVAEPLPPWKIAAAGLVFCGLALNAYASRPGIARRRRRVETPPG